MANQSSIGKTIGWIAAAVCGLRIPRHFLDRLVAPVPGAFRDIAKHSIAAKIAQVAVESGATEVSENHCIEGYIRATPKRDYRSLISFLEKQNIDYSPYKHLLNK